jgi:hypothetical protein
MNDRPRFALRFISGKYQGGEVPLRMNREIIIGRSSDLDMVLVEDMVSRRHAKISSTDAEVYIQDMGSTNGTFVNGEKINGRALLHEGDRILMLYQSANRDADAFIRPDDLILDRDPNPHLAFGIGTHYCLGANLARLEVKTVFQELFRRLPDIRVAEGARRRRGESSLVIAIQHLPAVFTAT